MVYQQQTTQTKYHQEMMLLEHQSALTHTLATHVGNGVIMPEIQWSKWWCDATFADDFHRRTSARRMR
jgi:hypothetical protein